MGGAGHARLAVTMCVSGWLLDADDFTRPWEPLSSLDAERIAVCWESEELLKLGKAFKAVMSDAGVMELVKGGAMHTALHGVLSAVALPAAFLTAASLIDNSWARALDRADQASALLAAALMDGAWYLRRPVTLLGYSLGARIVFGAMRRLAAAKAVGIVESVVLFGAPVNGDVAAWDEVRRVTAARLVNVYSENDWILALAYRATTLASGVAGLRAVPAEGVENINVTHLVRGHTSYPATLPQLLGVISAAPPSRRARLTRGPHKRHAHTDVFTTAFACGQAAATLRKMSSQHTSRTKASRRAVYSPRPRLARALSHARRARVGRL